MTVGEKLKYLREDSKLNANELSNKLNVSSTTIYYLESGRNLPNSYMITRICKYFHVSADWLLGLKEER